MDKVKKILIAIDDGPTAERVASAGFQLGKQLQVDIALISVVDTGELTGDAGVTPGELGDIIKYDLKKSQQMLADTIFKEYKIRTFVEKGKPFEVILKVAEEWEADLIVLGTHGRTGLSHFLMGSVAERVIRHSVKPIFIVPTRP